MKCLLIRCFIKESCCDDLVKAGFHSSLVDTHQNKTFLQLTRMSPKSTSLSFRGHKRRDKIRPRTEIKTSSFISLVFFSVKRSEYLISVQVWENTFKDLSCIVSGINEIFGSFHGVYEYTDTFSKPLWKKPSHVLIVVYLIWWPGRTPAATRLCFPSQSPSEDIAPTSHDVIWYGERKVWSFSPSTLFIAVC